MKLLKEIALWAVAIIGAAIMLIPVCTEPVDGWDAIYQLIVASVGMFVCFSATSHTKWGSRLWESKN